jgi:hypothetical protein
MTTLAEYNNNPGNIKPAKGVKYDGLIGVDEQGHGIFQTPEQGQKALINDLTYKLEKRGIKTPAEFVDAYNPAREGVDEEARDNYKIYIAQKLGLKSTNDPFPENAVDKLAQAVTAFEGGTWQTPVGGEKTAPKADSEPSSDGSSENQYGATPIGDGTTGGKEEDRDTSALETGVIGSILGGGAGSVYEAKMQGVRAAQRVGLLPGGKSITPADALKLTEQVMNIDSPVAAAEKVKATSPAAEAAARKTHGGENWQKSLTGISTPGAQMDKASLDLAKGMNQAVTGGAPGFTGGKITEGGIILNPRDAAAVNQKQQAAALKAQRIIELEKAAEIRQAEINERTKQVLLKNASNQDARIQQMLQRANTPNTFGQKVSRVASSAPVRGSLAGLGVGFNAQDAYNKFDQGDYVGATLAGGAAGASGLSFVPKLSPVMGPAAIGLTTASQVAGDLKRGDKQSAAESGLSGLAAMFPRVFGPLGALVYSGGLNQGEDEALERRRKMKATISP